MILEMTAAIVTALIIGAVGLVAQEYIFWRWGRDRR